VPYWGMKVFRCKRVLGPAPGRVSWIVQVAEDGGDFEAVEPMDYFGSEAECRVVARECGFRYVDGE
jgi:hypothetical protein